MKKDLLVLTLGRALQMILIFANYRLLTMVLPKEELGQYFFILSLTAVTGLIFINPLGTYFNRTLHSFKTPLQVKIQMLTVFLVILALAALNIPLVGLLSPVFESLGENWLYLAGVITFYVAATSANNTVVPVFNFFKQRTLFVVLTVASQGLALFWAWKLGSATERATLWLIGHAIGFATLAFLAMAFPVRVNQKDREKVASLPMPLIAKGAWAFAWPVAIVNIAVWMMTQGYRPYLEKVQGLEVLAEVGLGLGLASALAVAFEYLIQQIYQPDFYQATHSDPDSAWKSLAEKSFTHYAHFAFFLFLIAPFAMPVLADSKFQSAYIYLKLGAIVELFRMSTNLMALKAHGDLKTRRLKVPYLSASLVLVAGLGALTTWPFSGMALIGVLVASYTVLTVLIARANQVDFLQVAVKATMKQKWMYLSLILLLFFPHEWGEKEFELSLICCVVFGLIFLWWQYRKVVEFESREASS